MAIVKIQFDQRVVETVHADIEVPDGITDIEGYVLANQQSITNESVVDSYICDILSNSVEVLED